MPSATVRVKLAVRPATDRTLFGRFRKQAHVMLNYPGSTPAWQATTTIGRDALIRVTCDVPRHQAIGKPRTLDRRLECYVRDRLGPPCLWCSASLHQDRAFMQRVEADLCRTSAVAVRVDVAQTTPSSGRATSMTHAACLPLLETTPP